MQAITEREISGRIAKTTRISQAMAKVIIQCFIEEIVAELAKDNHLEFRDFGAFEVKTRAARMAVNPKTLEKVQVPAKRAVRFKMGRLMRQKVTAAATVCPLDI